MKLTHAAHLSYRFLCVFRELHILRFYVQQNCQSSQENTCSLLCLFARCAWQDEALPFSKLNVH